MHMRLMPGLVMLLGCSLAFAKEKQVLLTHIILRKAPTNPCLVVGAGQGIGRAYAHALGEAGAAVAVVDIQEEKAKQVCQELSRKGVRCVPIKADITNPEACEGWALKITHVNSINVSRPEDCFLVFLITGVDRSIAYLDIHTRNKAVWLGLSQMCPRFC